MCQSFVAQIMFVVTQAMKVALDPSDEQPTSDLTYVIKSRYAFL